MVTVQEPVYAEAGCYRRGQAAVSVLTPEFSVPVSPVFDVK